MYDPKCTKYGNYLIIMLLLTNTGDCEYIASASSLVRSEHHLTSAYATWPSLQSSEPFPVGDTTSVVLGMKPRLGSNACSSIFSQLLLCEKSDVHGARVGTQMSFSPCSSTSFAACFAGRGLPPLSFCFSFLSASPFDFWPDSSFESGSSSPAPFFAPFPRGFFNALPFFFACGLKASASSGFSGVSWTADSVS